VALGAGAEPGVGAGGGVGWAEEPNCVTVPGGVAICLSELFRRSPGKGSADPGDHRT
jgi:hypothetical protein